VWAVVKGVADLRRAVSPAPAAAATWLKEYQHISSTSTALWTAEQLGMTCGTESNSE
jgi:hypothetical protein